MDKLEFKKMLKEAIKSTDIAFVDECAQRLIIEGNPFYICDFAELVPLADNPKTMEDLTSAMIDCGDIYHLYEYLFCMYDSGKTSVPYAKLFRKVKDSGIAKIIYYCMETMGWCNTAEMEETLLKTEDYIYISAYYHNTEVEKFSPLIVRMALDELKENNKKYGLKHSVPAFYKDNIYRYSGLEYLTELQKVLIIARNQGNPMMINMAAEYQTIEPEDMDKAFFEMLKSENELHIYEYYCSMKDRLTEKQRDEILNYIYNCGNAKIMYYICAWTDADYDTCRWMQEAIEKTGNKKYIEKVEKTIIERFGVMV